MTIKENEAFKKEQFKRSQKLFELRSHERELISNISGGQGQNKNLAVRITHLDEQVGLVLGIPSYFTLVWRSEVTPVAIRSCRSITPVMLLFFQ